MPIYEYQCQKCGTFETTQRITDKPLTKCPTCKGKVRKLISNTSFQLKGTGWYITDYARKGNGDGSKSESSAKSSTETKSDSKKGDTSSKTTGEKTSTASSSAST